MTVNTLSVGAAVTPTVIETYIKHYLNRSPLRLKPTAHISYHEGLELIRRFLHYASLNTVDELQAFTSQWVPVPHWVHSKEVEIPRGQLDRAAAHINAQLGPKGIEAVGGETWWQWRREKTQMKAEWIEMRTDRDAREKSDNPKGQRIMLYVHGGAYYFGSVDEHRYQMQRHARKLQARVLAPRYRLSPQFPFPCGLMDCLATYLLLLEEGIDPNTVILAGDSAGGGMVLSMLVVMRDQGIPLPAGAILISPWVDLTHSFPSLNGDDKMDYIPSHGFVHKPSMSWPPPNADDMLLLEQIHQSPQNDRKTSTDAAPPAQEKEDKQAKKEAKAERVRGYSVKSKDQPNVDTLLNSTEAQQNPNIWVAPNNKYAIGPKGTLSVQLDKERIEIKDQIQLYTENHLLTHPLVSPALQPTLGGLPPLLIQTGGGELLRDEQIYVAHKAAHPAEYLPPPSNNQTAEEIEAQASKYKPTHVQLQVWDDLCHVAPTLSFTRPAKHMYRSIAQFGAWALARAQKTSIDILDDDDISFVSTDSESSGKKNKSQSGSNAEQKSPQHFGTDGLINKSQNEARVGKAGDSLPPFVHHMIRQRVDRHGYIYALPPKEELDALNMPIDEVGVPKAGPVGKWMKASQQWNGKFSKQKLKIQKQRMEDMKKEFERFDGEKPPPTALAGRRIKNMKAEKAKKKSWGMALWSLWGSKHDEATITREKNVDRSAGQPGPSKNVSSPDPSGSTTDSGFGQPQTTSRGLEPNFVAPQAALHRSRSGRSTVTDQGQAGSSLDDLSKLSREFSRAAPPSSGLAEATVLAPERGETPLLTPMTETGTSGLPTPGIVISDNPTSPVTLIPATDGSSTRPTKGGIAYPFSLKVGDALGSHPNASMVTLESLNITTPPAVDEPQYKELVANEPVVADEPVVVHEPAVVHEPVVADEPVVTDESAVADKPVVTDAQDEQTDQTRPGVERFYTTASGAGLFSSGAGLFSSGTQEEGKVADEPAKAERPGVERFETALEDLSTLSAAKEKV